VSRFKDYSRTENRDLIERAFNGTDFLKNVPGRMRDLYADIPDKFSCAGPVPVKKETVSRSDYMGSLIRYCISVYLGTG
jgi:hypothetical protein